MFFHGDFLARVEDHLGFGRNVVSARGGGVPNLLANLIEIGCAVAQRGGVAEPWRHLLRIAELELQKVCLLCEGHGRAKSLSCRPCVFRVENCE